MNYPTVRDQKINPKEIKKWGIKLQAKNDKTNILYINELSIRMSNHNC